MDGTINGNSAAISSLSKTVATNYRNITTAADQIKNNTQAIEKNATDIANGVGSSGESASYKWVTIPAATADSTMAPIVWWQTKTKTTTVDIPEGTKQLKISGTGLSESYIDINSKTNTSFKYTVTHTSATSQWSGGGNYGTCQASTSATGTVYIYPTSIKIVNATSQKTSSQTGSSQSCSDSSLSRTKLTVVAAYTQE